MQTVQGQPGHDFSGGIYSNVVFDNLDLTEGKTRGKAVSEWCAQRGITPPGKTVIANRLVNNPDQINLELSAVAFLKDLHLKLTDVLKL